ncbi:MAG TPA: sugar ABC transporter ATP-binding protein [Ktedonobacteraceae bacterium]|nr:sugar ABC transporter ATP-binding protein [Ktedonobacteraceae bacterium]
MAGSDYMLEAEQIHKSYGGIAALKGVDFRVRAGSVHALVGENGAGKSTLVKILAGAISPDAGVLRLAGQETHFSSTAEAAARGVAVVSQELSLFPDLDVLSNLFPVHAPTTGPFVARSRIWEQARPVFQELSLEVDPRTPVEALALEQRQLVEIARALMIRPRVLILDEPTSALHARATERLHEVLRVLRQRDVAVVYISHILEDVLSLCDEVTVLRDGERVVDAEPVASLSIDEIVRAILGNKAPAQSQSVAPRQPASGQRALRLEHVSVPGWLEDVTLEAPAGAITGVAGLSGSGHQEALYVAAGALRPDKGRVVLPDGTTLRPGLRNAIQQGIALVPGDRQRIGLMLDKPIWDNVAQVRAVALRRDGAFLRSDRLRARARAHVERLGIRTPSVDQEVRYLSGGNQQKVVFAKWLETDASVLLLDDPTRGIDVGARAEIYGLMRNLAAQGAIQVLASTDPRELALICNRVFVFYRGRVCAVLEPPHLDAHTILEVVNTGILP